MSDTQQPIPETIDSNRYSYFEALYLSFFSADLYVDVGKRWRGFGLLYLLLVLFIISIPWSIKNAIAINDYFYQHVTVTVAKVPPLAITNGEITIVPQVPFRKRTHYTIVDPVDKLPFIVIDTTGKTTSLKQSHSKILITNDKIISALVNANPQEQTIANDINGTITAKELLDILYKSKQMLMISLYPTTVMTLYVALLMSLYIFSIIGVFISNIFLKQKLAVKQSLRLTNVAATPVLIVLSVFYLSGIVFAAIGLVLFVLLVCYYIYAVRSYKISSRQLVV